MVSRRRGFWRSRLRRSGGSWRRHRHRCASSSSLYCQQRLCNRNAHVNVFWFSFSRCASSAAWMLAQNCLCVCVCPAASSCFSGRPLTRLVLPSAAWPACCQTLALSSGASWCAWHIVRPAPTLVQVQQGGHVHEVELHCLEGHILAQWPATAPLPYVRVALGCPR